MLHNEDNDYSIDHIMKDKLERNGKLPDVMDVAEEAAHLFDVNDTDDETK